LLSCLSCGCSKSHPSEASRPFVDDVEASDANATRDLRSALSGESPKPAPSQDECRVSKAYIAKSARRCSGASFGVAHVVCADGRDLPLSTDKRAVEVRIAPDGETIGVLTADEFVDKGVCELDPTTLAVFHGARFVTPIQGAPLLRSWAFAAGGREVVAEAGGLHFAGSYMRFDASNGHVLASASEVELGDRPPPAWAEPLAPKQLSSIKPSAESAGHAKPQVERGPHGARGHADARASRRGKK
jgi:hypothetical protein